MESPLLPRQDALSVPPLGLAHSGACDEHSRRRRPADTGGYPGTENPELEEALASAGIEVVKACTLVMLRTGQFGS